MLLRWTTDPSSSLDRIASWMAYRNQRFNALPSNGHAEEPTVWKPPVDVHEDGERILLVADLPGLERSDVALPKKPEAKPRQIKINVAPT
jgi:HSP20 family molecular chaperone IbpA